MREGLGAVRQVNGVGTGLPSQHQPSGPDSMLEIIIPLGAEFDILRRLVTLKDPLHPFIKPLSKRCQVLGGVEF